MKDLHEHLRKRIIEEDLKPGEFLVEREISLAYDVSRTPVREALRRLVADGLVVLDRGRGYSVRQLSVDDILEVFIAREAVEGTLASLATGRADVRLVERLSGIRRSLEAVDPAKQPSMAVILGKQLHDEIATAAENRILHDFYRKLRDVAALTRNMSKKSAEVEVLSRQEHLKIIDAIISGNREDAERQMRQHLRRTCEHMLKEYIQRRMAPLGMDQTIAFASTVPRS